MNDLPAVLLSLAVTAFILLVIFSQFLAEQPYENRSKTRRGRKKLAGIG